MKKLALKSALLLGPFFLFMVLEVFVLPIDFFAFRAWEAISTLNYPAFPGVFYANQKLNAWSAGDLDPHGPRTRLIDFETDRYGYRNRARAVEPQRYDVVTVGDSLIAGSHLKQNETVAEVLARKCNCETYNYAKGGTQQLLQLMADPRFMEEEHRPRFVIFESRKGDMYNMQLRFPIISDMPLDYTVRKPSFWDFAWDRYAKHMGLRSLQSRLKLTSVIPWSPPKELPPIDQIVDNTRKSIFSFNKFFKDRGIQFVFFVMPSQDRSFDHLFEEFEQAGIPTIGHLPKPGLPDGYHPENYYFKEDTHWRPESAASAAEEIYQKIQSLSSRPSERITRN